MNVEINNERDDDTEDLSNLIYIKIAFFKGDRKKFHHRFIRWWTKSTYSHAELVLPDGETWVSISPFIYSQVGARIKTNFEERDWDFIIFEISEKQLHSLKDFISETTGDEYDWPGMLMSQILPFIIKSRQKWYCSSWIAHALSHAGIIKWRKLGIYEVPDLHPGKLYHILSKIKQT
jgi:hypothetical protein